MVSNALFEYSTKILCIPFNMKFNELAVLGGAVCSQLEKRNGVELLNVTGAPFRYTTLHVMLLLVSGYFA